MSRSRPMIVLVMLPVSVASAFLLGGGMGARPPVTECTTEAALTWFGPPASLPDCFQPPGSRRFPGFPGMYVDVNADGRAERFLCPPTPVLSNGIPVVPPADLVSLVTLSVVDGEVRAVRRPVLRSDAISAWVVAATGGQGDIRMDEARWNDLDGDGDLDLILILEGWIPGQSFGDRSIWLENTGFEAARRPIGDLDGNGRVDSADLTILLGAWGS